MKLTLEMAQKMMQRNGGNLDLSGTGITSFKNIRRLRNGDYKEGRYLYADNILTHVKRKLVAGGYTYFEGKIPGRNVIFDGTKFAHCETRRQGLADLRFKAAANRGAEQYKDLPLDHELPLDEMVTMYRVITGACRQGSQAFVDSLGDKLKDSYTIQEVIELTKDQYGGKRFAEFFRAESRRRNGTEDNNEAQIRPPAVQRLPVAESDYWTVCGVSGGEYDQCGLHQKACHQGK